MERANMMKAMKASISEVLGTMFFQMVQIVNADSTLQEWLAPEHPLLGATLDFNGPWAGSFYLFIPLGAANSITANFLGLNAGEVDEDQQNDTVKEMLNMIGGGLLSIYDQKGVFKLGIPQLIEKGDLTLDTFEGYQQDFVLFETKDNHLAAGIVLA